MLDHSADSLAGNCSTKPHLGSLCLGGGDLILLIDDHAALLRLTKKMLEAGGYRVLATADCEEAMAWFAEKQGQINLVVTDSHMPLTNGNGVIRTIRAVKPEFPFLVATGFKCGSEELDSLRRESVRILEKPYTFHQFLLAVTFALHGDN
jgi:DNA-binding NtrC family response regulator